MNQLLKKALIYGMTVTTMMTVGIPDVYAYSTVEMTREMKNYGTEMKWEDPDTAPTLRVTFTDAYKLRGKQEIFEINLNGAEWIEGEDTTLSISDSEGIEVYDAYVATDSKTKARVVVNIPKTMEENKTVSLDIPLVIFTTTDSEEISASIRETDSKEGLVEDTTVPLAISTSKQMAWQLGTIPHISEGESIAPITFTETQAGILGDRDFELWLYINNRYLRFKEPDYEAKTENSDDIVYELDPAKYLDCQGGFDLEGKKLKVTITKDGKRMRVCTNGNVPSSKGILTLKNFKIESTTTESLDEPVNITLQSEQILNNNSEFVAAYYKTKEKEVSKEEVIQDEGKLDQEADKEPVVIEDTKKEIRFTVGQENYLVNGENHPMSGKTYVKEPGYTMVPIRYVLEALGVTEINYNDKEVSFTYDEHTIRLTADSAQAFVDGQLQMLQIPLEVKEGRTYAPIGSVANLLGIQKSWDSKTQTACFER